VKKSNQGDTSRPVTIPNNLANVRRRIDEACRRSGRTSDSVTLVAVTKYAELKWVRQLIGLGVTELGENRPQQLVQRAGLITEPVAWHLIGNLQRNKVRAVLPHVSLIHSVDSLRLLEAIERIAGELDLRPRVLLEVHLSGEAAKQGFDVAELQTAWDQIVQLDRTQVTGLMTMAAYSENPEDARPVFSRLRELRDELRSRCTASFADRFQQLSMGMTGDFEVAIEEGARLVRIGSALWEGLKAPSENSPGSQAPEKSGEAAPDTPPHSNGA
jgi:pyridoxal phosphate enzyme (YggS family)